jgi:hypothetical protein
VWNGSRTAIGKKSYHELLWNGASRVATLEGLKAGQNYKLSLTFSTDAGESELATYSLNAGHVPDLPDEAVRIECTDCATDYAAAGQTALQAFGSKKTARVNITLPSFTASNPKYSI